MQMARSAEALPRPEGMLRYEGWQEWTLSSRWYTCDHRCVVDVAQLVRNTRLWLWGSRVQLPSSTPRKPGVSWVSYISAQMCNSHSRAPPGYVSRSEQWFR